MSFDKRWSWGDLFSYWLSRLVVWGFLFLLLLGGWWLFLQIG